MGQEKKRARETTCFQNGIKIFGDAWTLFIINSLQDGEKRFCELQRLLNNLNPVTLSSRLKKLEKLKFIERKEETIDKLSVTYALTEKGSGMLVIIKDIEAYAQKYLRWLYGNLNELKKYGSLANSMGDVE